MGILAAGEDLGLKSCLCTAPWRRIRCRTLYQANSGM